MRPLLLDLFCGAGGAAMGYHRAGFNVVGVDIEPQPHYPFEFVRADAIEYMGRLSLVETVPYAAVHASPPCQAFTKYKNARPDLPTKYPDLIDPTRRLLHATGLPYVIENVVGAPIYTQSALEWPEASSVRLCGSMFGLDVERHRWFESNVPLTGLTCDHAVWEPNRFPGGRSRERGGPRVLCRGTVEVGRWNIPLDTQKRAMGIDWMALEELSEAIPPAYTQFIGEALLEHVSLADCGVVDE